jgi:hypothetical protein
MIHLGSLLSVDYPCHPTVIGTQLPSYVAQLHDGTVRRLSIRVRVEDVLPLVPVLTELLPFHLEQVEQEGV